MIDAGIDIAACEYWAGEAFSAEGISKMVTALDELKTDGKTPRGLAMFFDTVPLWGSDLTADKGKQFFYSSIKTFFSLVPQRYWGLIDDRPVIWLYDTGGDHISQFDASTFEYLRDRFKSDFDVDQYIVADWTWLIRGLSPSMARTPGESRASAISGGTRWQGPARAMTTTWYAAGPRVTSPRVRMGSSTRPTCTSLWPRARMSSGWRPGTSTTRLRGSVTRRNMAARTSTSPASTWTCSSGAKSPPNRRADRSHA